MNAKLIGPLKMLDWLCRDRYERAEASQKAAHEAGEPYPHSQQEMVQWQIDMLRAQIELEQEASKPNPSMYDFTPKGGADGMMFFGIVPHDDAPELPTTAFTSSITPYTPEVLT